MIITKKKINRNKFLILNMIDIILNLHKKLIIWGIYYIRLIIGLLKKNGQPIRLNKSKLNKKREIKC